MGSDLPGEAQILEEHLVDKGYSKGVEDTIFAGHFERVTSDQERTALEIEGIIDKDTAKQILRVALIWGKEYGYIGGETRGSMAAIWKDSEAAGKVALGVRVPVTASR
jgi:hypothetical protein